MKIFKLNDFLPVIKYHPRNKLSSNQILDSFEVYSEKELNLINLNSFSFIIAQYSTVLFQAYTLGISILVDDISNERLFSTLQERMYILAQEKHGNMLLSRHLKLLINEETS